MTLNKTTRFFVTSVLLWGALEQARASDAFLHQEPEQRLVQSSSMSSSRAVIPDDPSEAPLRTGVRAEIPDEDLGAPDIASRVLSLLKGFGLASDQAQTRWQELRHISTIKYPRFLLASQEPYFLALGLWKAHQISLTQDKESQAVLPFRSLLSCTLTGSVSLKGVAASSSSSAPKPFLRQLTELGSINPYFRALDLFRLSVQDTDLPLIAPLSHLTELSLEENILTDQGLPSLLTLPHLSTLNLSKNCLTAQGARILAQSPALRRLNLYKNALGDEGAIFLSNHTGLLDLDLRETGVKDKGAQALALNKTLKILRLRYNQITDQGAEAFLSNTTLTHVELERNPISLELRAFLEQQLMPGSGYREELTRTLTPLPRNLLPAQKRKVRILAIDGGGIRGLLPARILHYIAEEISRKTGAPFHFAQHCDVMAGTSTGGLITLGLAVPGERGRPQYTPQVLVDLYTAKGQEIFPAPWLRLKKVIEAQYNPQPLERILEQYFGDTPLSACLCKMLITSFDLVHHQAHTFDSHDALREESKDFLIRSVARATSAAPTYFPSARVKNIKGEEFEFVDGGIYANNPTLLALKRARDLYPEAREYTVFSFGTGEGTKESLSKLGKKGLIHWGANIAGVLMGNAAGYTQELLRQECKHDPRIRYIRIQPALVNPGEKKMDNVELSNIQTLLTTAEQTIQEHGPQLDDMISDLLTDYQTQ